MRLINADALIEILKRNKQFFIDAWGGSFHAMSEKDKARCDEIDNCIAEILTAPTIEPDGDTISRQGAINAIENTDCKLTAKDWDELTGALKSLPSAEAEPIVIRSKTPLATKDFKKWAKRIREVNTNAIAIPCDAEVVSSETAQAEGDLISRQAAVLTITGEPPEAHYPSWYAERIKSLPSAPDSRQRGEWVPNHIPNSMLYECNQCGFDCGAYTFNFCPNCGADMRKGGDINVDE